MLERLNNIWTYIIAIILFIVIIKKIIKLNKPFDQQRFIEQIQNQKKLKEKISIDMIKNDLPILANHILL